MIYQGVFMTKIRNSDDYVSTEEWLEAVIDGDDLILRRTSALEYHQLFVGFVNEQLVEVFSLQPINEPNIDCCVVPSFDHIEYELIRQLKCTTVEFTVNEMLRDFDTVDPEPLIEALAHYYFSHNDSFDGLNIWNSNLPVFNEVKEWAKCYYNVG
jgi:hypothetical protein